MHLPHHKGWQEVLLQRQSRIIRSQRRQTNHHIPNYYFYKSQTSHAAISESSNLEPAGGVEHQPKNQNNVDNNKNNKQGWLGRVQGYFLPKRPDDGLTLKQRLDKMGVATVLSYGMISKLSYAILVALAWYTFAVKVST